ncbi:unnamed protein product [Fusarium venenatum]|uniref:Uncharacterized protein n=1 Tax=Fusarium venenatum TaxID=56646 RepID=A0A2L2U1B9_9HYPO|nr:uncharacterized protein FVRRES_09067 [Fusarium venenatum]KAH6965779.1 Up-regulated during septation-domain-containing protein [Fusarium venenatum]CEI68990.1 unnamed protein product [Fusarium venenatum]
MSAYAREGSPYGFDSSRMSPTAASPRGKTFVEGYRSDIMNGFEKDQGLYNPMNPERPQSSALVDLRDPIQVHLLTETALSDSKEYAILSQEEVDDLKKQCQSLSQRVESTRQNLTIQSKYRDAAISMARLYNPGKLDGKRRSLLGRNSGDHARAKEAETERQASERKCEELAAELFNLEKRLMDPQRRLLEHTAGILQLTHKASNKKKDMTPTLHPMNGMPGSPESLYTYTRNSMDRAGDEHFFHDDNHFGQANGVSTRGPPRQQPIEIPLKSPIREQHSQLKDEMEKIKDENLHLKGQSDSLVTSITEMEARLENLNGSLRDAIVRFNPSKNEEYYDPPFGVPGMKPGELLNNQMDYLEMGLNAIEVEQEESSGDSGKVDSSIDKRIESLNQQVRDLLVTVDPEYPAAPQSSQDSIESKLTYLEDALCAADSELERAVQISRSGPPEKQDDEQVERILMNLWNMMQTGFTKIKKEKEERRRTRIERGYEDEEVSDDEFDIDEAFSLPGFSNRVQWLYSQATTLKNQKSVLKRQIKQQRELNNKSDAEKDEELARKQEELDETQILLARAERDAMSAQAMLEQTLEELEGTGVARNIGAQKAQSEESTKKIADLESELKRLQSDLAGAAGAAGAAHAQVEDREDKIDSLEKELENVRSDLADATAAAAAAQAQINDRDNKITALESELAYLETAQSEIEERNKRIAALQADLEQANAAHTQIDERDAKIATLHTEIQEANTFRDQVEVHTATIATLKAELEKTNDIEARLEERNAKVARLESDMELLQVDLAGAAGAAGTAQGQLEERNSRIAALEASVKQLEKKLADAESSSNNNRNQLTGVDSVIEALNAQLDEVNRSKQMAENNARSLQQRVESQKDELAAKKKQLKEKEDELELLNMNFVETKTELTIAQAELDGAYGSRAERAADVAAIKTSGEVMKLQNQLTRLKNELAGTVQELEDVTKETLSAEREKIELENNLQDVQVVRRQLEGEVATLRRRLESDMEEARGHITKLQEDLDSERLKAIPPNGGVGRGASVLSEQFRATMREERKKFQDNIREERARTRQLEEELAKLKRVPTPTKVPPSPQ